MFQLAPINLSPENVFIDVNKMNEFKWTCIGSTPTHATLTFYLKATPLTPISTYSYVIANVTDDNTYTLLLNTGFLSNEQEYLWSVTSYTGASGKTSESVYFQTHQTVSVFYATPVPSIIYDIKYIFSPSYSLYSGTGQQYNLKKYIFKLFLS